MNTKSGNFQVEVPILLTLTQNIPQLCHHLLGDEDNLQRAHWVSKLLSSLAMYSKECIAVNILAHLLVSAIKPFQLTYLSHLMTVIEPTASHLLSEMTISQIMTQSLGRGKHCSEQFLKNVWCVVQWEAEGLGGFSMTRLRFTDCLSRFLQPLADQLTHPSIEAACCTMGVLARIPIPDSLSMTVLTSLATSTVTFFIEVIARMELSSKIAEIPVCCKFVSKLCKHTSAQNMTLRFLLEAVLDVNNCHYFNGKTSNECAANTINNSASINETVSLLEENQKHAVSNTLPQSHSTVFHAGIIGNGLRPQCNTSTRPQDEILVNTQLLLEMIKSACVPCRRLADEKLSVGPVPTIQGMTTVALLLVELVSSDVMFNGLPWPEEEFTKVTIERDLYIKRMFDFNPFLWDLLYLVAHCRPALCYCSVLLRALAATMMSFWAASQAKMTLECRKHLNLTCRLIDVMAIGQLLPPPLSLISEIFPKISPYEAHILLGDVWKYMKDNVPSPVAFVTSDPQSYPWRDFGRICDQKYTTRLHCILQSNMAKFGPLFIRFFSADDKM